MDILMVMIFSLLVIAAILVIAQRIYRNRINEQSQLYDEKYSELNDKYEAQQRELIATTSNISVMKEQISNRDMRISELQTNIQSIGNNEQQLQSKLLELSKENSTLRTERDSVVNLRGDNIMQIEQLKKEAVEQQQRSESLSKANASYLEQIASRNTKIKELEEQVVEIKGSEAKLEERLNTQFAIISNKIIEDSRNKVNEFNASRMQELVKPFEKELKEFKEQISTANKEQSRERTELEVKIKQMVEISQGMSAEAKNLTNALRGNNKTAGNWGETILENILQNSGLTEGKEGYELQEMLRDSAGNAYRNEGGRKMIPDAIVHFPDNRNVIIDSKVSIAAYTDYCNAENEEEKKIHLKKHLLSIKNHIDELNVKSYEQYVSGSLDFVMMFIPNDFAAMVALQADLNLWQNGYNKKILIISPTNLITSLKIVSDLWSREKQQQNVERILERGRFLYDKCCTFTESFRKIGDSLQAVTKIYDSASVQLGESSGIIRQAEMLVESGIKSKKTLAIQSKEQQEEGTI